MDYLQVHVGKFIFRIARDFRYSDADIWAKCSDHRVRVGLDDYLQQKSGDVAFVNVKEVGTVLVANEELASVETVKVDLVIPAPLAGKIVAINTELVEHPELVNGDPYDAGWIVEIEPDDIADFDVLMDAETYLPHLQKRAEQERQK